MKNSPTIRKCDLHVSCDLLIDNIDVLVQRCRSRDIFELRRIFARIPPNLPDKFSGNFFPTQFKNALWDDLQKQIFM